MANASHDANNVPTLIGVNDVTGLPQPVLVNSDGAILISVPGAGAGTVTDVSVVSANGFAGTVATSTTTPAITLTTTVTGILSGNGTAISAASTTGSGAVVLASAPTIVTPTIASFANANHNHQNSAGGGSLDAAAIGSGTVATARLGSGTANNTTFLRGDQTWATPAGSGNVSAGSNLTDNAIVRGDGGTTDVQTSGVIIDDTDNVTGMATLTLPNTGLHLLDTNASHDLIIAPGSNISADRTLSLVTGDADRSITLTGNLAMSGAFNLTLTQTGDTNVTLPATGTLATLAGSEAFTNKTYNGLTITSTNGTLTLANGSSLVTSGANSITLTSGAATNVTLPATGTLATLAGSEALTNKTVNGLTITSTTGTLTIASGKTASISNTLTFTGTDSSSVAFGAGGTVVYTNVTTLSSLASIGTITTGVWNGTDIAVADGGTGTSSLTAYAVLCGGTTSTGAVQSVASVGTAGQVLTSNGAAALPTFQDAAGGGTPKTGKATYDLSTASGTQNIAHGLGSTPSLIEITFGYSYSVGGASSTSQGFGSYNGTNTVGIYFAAGPTNEFQSGNSTTNIISVFRALSGTVSKQEAVPTFDATNITLTWTKTSTPTGTLEIYWKAYP